MLVVLSQRKGYAKRQTVGEKPMLEEPHPQRNMPAGASNHNILSTNVWNRMTSGMSDVSMDKDNLASFSYKFWLT